MKTCTATSATASARGTRATAAAATTPSRRATPPRGSSATRSRAATHCATSWRGDALAPSSSEPEYKDAQAGEYTSDVVCDIISIGRNE
eukprot:7434535-Pyramimonas_sp.AAC.1